MIYYEAITKKNLADYRDVILPDLYEELNVMDTEPIGLGYLCIGARDDKSKQTAGAIAGILMAEEDGSASIMIRSIFVRRGNRRNKIGNTLISRLLTVAAGTYLFPEGEEEVEIMLKIQYLLNRYESEQFTAFLQDFGFTDYAEEEMLFRLSEWELMELDILRPSLKPNKNCRPFSEAGEELREEIEEYTGHSMEPDLSFAYVKGEDITGMVVTEELSPGHYWIIAAEHDGTLTDAQMMSLLRTTAAAIEQKTRHFTVTVEPGDEIIKGLLMSAPGVVTITPKLAWVYVNLEKPADK